MRAWNLTGIALLILASNVVSRADEFMTKEDVRRLIYFADKWEIPQPKPGSKLVTISNRNPTEKNCHFWLGFVEPGEPNRAIVGDDYMPIGESRAVVVADPARLSFERAVIDTLHTRRIYDFNLGLITGAQLLRRGDERAGIAMIQTACSVNTGNSQSLFHSPANDPPDTMLARCGIASALNDLAKAKPPFVQIKRRIERILSDQPQLKSEATTYVLEALAANVAHQQPPEGSIERIVDDYLMSAAPRGYLGWHIRDNPAAFRLVIRGFDAIPALIKERHSKRFTNHVMWALRNESSWPMNAGQVIDSYLSEFACDDLGIDWLSRIKGFGANDELVNKWWKEASALGEETYVKKHAVAIGDVIDEEDVAGAPETQKLRHGSLSGPLFILAVEKYPHLLPDIYLQVIKTSFESHPVAEAFMKVDRIPRERKIELLIAGIATNHGDHRHAAALRLRKLDSARADEFLLKFLEEAEGSPKSPGVYERDDGLGGLVGDSTNLEVWRSFDALLDRADVQMRMELIYFLRPPRTAPREVLRAFQRIFLRFRNDTAVRDNADWDLDVRPPSHAGFRHDRISMRNYIHQKFAEWLELKIKEPDDKATEEEWRKYREIVSREVEKFFAGVEK